MREYVKRIVLLSCFAMLAAFSHAESDTSTEAKEAFHNTLPAMTQALIKASYKEKADIIDSIAAIEDDNKLLILQSLLDNKLYYQKKSQDRILIVDMALVKAKKPNAMLDAFSQEDAVSYTHLTLPTTPYV